MGDLVGEDERPTSAVISEQAFAQDVSSDQYVKPLRSKKSGLKYRDRGVDKCGLAAIARNVNAHVVLIGYGWLISSRRTVDKRTTGWRDVELDKDRWVNACAACARIYESLDRNWVRHRLTRGLERVCPSLAYADQGGNK